MQCQKCFEHKAIYFRRQNKFNYRLKVASKKGFDLCYRCTNSLTESIKQNEKSGQVNKGKGTGIVATGIVGLLVSEPDYCL